MDCSLIQKRRNETHDALKEGRKFVIHLHKYQLQRQYNVFLMTGNPELGQAFFRLTIEFCALSTKISIIIKVYTKYKALHYMF